MLSKFTVTPVKSSILRIFNCFWDWIQLIISNCRHKIRTYLHITPHCNWDKNNHRTHNKCPCKTVFCCWPYCDKNTSHIHRYLCPCTLPCYFLCKKSNTDNIAYVTIYLSIYLCVRVQEFIVTQSILNMKLSSVFRKILTILGRAYNDYKTSLSLPHPSLYLFPSHSPISLFVFPLYLSLLWEQYKEKSKIKNMKTHFWRRSICWERGAERFISWWHD